MPLAVKDDTIYAIRPPLDENDVEALNTAFNYPMGTVIYVPFDPFTFEIPDKKMDYKIRQINNHQVVYSPNVWEVLMKYYAKIEEKNGKKYLKISKIPILIVDYHTPMSASYHGEDKPPDMPIDAQYKTWKNGYMMGRVRLENKTVTICTYYSPRLGCLKVKKLKFADGYWWVKYEARLLEFPASMVTTTKDVFKFYYEKPKTTLRKIPGVSWVVDYIYKHKLSGDGVKELRKMLNLLGWDIDYSRTYKTDKGKTVKGPYVEETNNGYVVYIPAAKKVESLAIQLGLEVLVLVAILSLTLCVSLYLIKEIKSEENEPIVVPVQMVKEAQDNWLKCRELCDKEYPNDPKKREECYRQCNKTYADVVNAAREAQEQNKEKQKHWLLMPSGGIPDSAKVVLVAIGIVGAVMLLRRR